MSGRVPLDVVDDGARELGGNTSGGSLLDRIAAGAATVTVGAMIATPLLPRGGRGRRILSSVVVGSMFATTTANAARRWGSARALGAGGLVAVATAVVERVGTRTGLPFGRYAYSDALRPQVWHVPVVVPLAWFAMGLPSREAAHGALGEESTPGRRIALGAAAMTAWDLFLDPQMVGEGYWNWARRGVYRGIPLSNFAGWFVTAVGIMGILEATLPAGRRPDVRQVAHYGYVSVMQTLGFARFFRDPLVALVGGVGMLPIAAASAARLAGGATSTGGAA